MQNEFSLTYAITRTELWKWYWSMWLKRLWVLHVIAAGYILLKQFTLYTNGTESLTSMIVTTAVMFAIYLLFVISYPQIMFKSQTRLFKANEQGIHTEIGKKSGDISWDQVESVEDKGEYISIVRKKTLNSFIVPNRAFETAESRSRFLESISHWKESHAS